MVFEHSSYRSFLKTVLVDRIGGNPAYSMLAIARQLVFSSSQLSEAIAGKANFSAASLRKIAKKLALTHEESLYLSLLGELESEKDPEIRESLLLRLQGASPEKE